MPPHVSLVGTHDGSPTLFHEGLATTYRSLHGARTEARYVFLERSTIQTKPFPWKILELGFGTGMNFVETALACLSHGPEGRLVYHSIERAPIDPVWLEAVLPLGADNPHKPALLAMMQEALAKARKQRGVVQIQKAFDDRLTLILHPCDWKDVSLPDFQADAIYHDPFAPKVNPDAWTDACFSWMAQHLGETGLLVTYSAASSIRRSMSAAGLVTARAPGSGSKKEMTVAALSHAPLVGLPIVLKEAK